MNESSWRSWRTHGIYVNRIKWNGYGLTFGYLRRGTIQLSYFGLNPKDGERNTISNCLMGALSDSHELFIDWLYSGYKPKRRNDKEIKARLLKGLPPI